MQIPSFHDLAHYSRPENPNQTFLDPEAAVGPHKDAATVHSRLGREAVRKVYLPPGVCTPLERQEFTCAERCGIIDEDRRYPMTRPAPWLAMLVIYVPSLIFHHGGPVPLNIPSPNYPSGRGSCLRTVRRSTVMSSRFTWVGLSLAQRAPVPRCMIKAGIHSIF